jgi:voltage-gated potassium channel
LNGRFFLGTHSRITKGTEPTLLTYKIRKFIVRYFATIRWHTLFAIMLGYTLISWVMLYLAGETALLSPNDFLYWLMVTGSTVGYGDMSPTTDAGKYLVAFWVIPVGLSLFALVIGRIAAKVSQHWQRGVKGLKTLDVENHILVIGWNGQRTLHLLDLLLGEKAQFDKDLDIVLCVRAEIDNPMPGKIEFVRVASFNKDDDMDRACINQASVIIMDNPEDDLTMTTALYCNQRNPDAHALAYFKDESLVKLLQSHCPNVECTPSVAVEMLAKSAFDPGSSMLHHDLLSVNDTGQAQFSCDLPKHTPPITVANLFHQLKDHYQATFIGYSSQGQTQQLQLNPSLEKQLSGGDRMYYIAEKRIANIDWSSFS